MAAILAGDCSSREVDEREYARCELDPGSAANSHSGVRQGQACAIADWTAERIRKRIGPDEPNKQRGPHPTFGDAEVEVYSWGLKRLGEGANAAGHW